MLPDVGMVQMYSKSANVNGLGFAWIGWPPLCMDQPPPCSYVFSARWFCHTLQVHTAPSLHLPLFLEKTFLRTLVSQVFMKCKKHMGCTMDDLLEWLPNNSGNKGMCSDCMAGCVAHCGMWLGGQP